MKQKNAGSSITISGSSITIRSFGSSCILQIKRDGRLGPSVNISLSIGEARRLCSALQKYCAEAEASK